MTPVLADPLGSLTVNNVTTPSGATFSRPLSVGPNVVTVNVLEDEEVRQGIKEFSNWPTIPQLYVKGEFIGGADILNEMHQSGELQTLLKG